MTSVAVRVERLGKRYRIGARARRHDTLRDAVIAAAAAPWRALRGVGRGAPRDDDPARTIWALRDVSFELRAGEVLGVIGGNGAGKSTLLKILARITPPTEGRAEVYGRVGSLLEVGTGFHHELTGRENVFLSGAILGMDTAYIRRKFEEIVEFSGVGRFIDTPVKRYSSGMYLRLAFAVAAHLEPDVLVVDEVLAVGDAEFQRKCLGKMGDAAGEGRTVLFVSHNMGAVTALCPTALWLADGAVAAAGPAGETVAAYLAASAGRGATETSLSRLRRPGMGREAWFTMITLPESRQEVLLHEPLRFDLSATAARELRDLNVGASLYAVTGECIGTLHTRETYSLAPGRETRLELEVAGISLAPGEYYAGFAIGSGTERDGRRDLDIVVGTPRFRVLPYAGDGDAVVMWPPQWGNVILARNRLRVSHDLTDRGAAHPSTESSACTIITSPA